MLWDGTCDGGGWIKMRVCGVRIAYGGSSSSVMRATGVRRRVCPAGRVNGTGRLGVTTRIEGRMEDSRAMAAAESCAKWETARCGAEM